MKANSGVRKALKARKNISSIQSDLVILHHEFILSRNADMRLFYPAGGTS